LLFCKLIQKRNPVTLGFRKKGAFKEYLIGLATGFLVFSAAVLICVVTGAMKIEGISETFGIGMFVLFMLGFMIQGMAEEVLCRGYFLVSLGRRNSMWAAIMLNALAFAALHLLNDGISVLAFANLVLYGVFISIYFIKRGNIWVAGGFHSVWNLAQGNIYGILVSGMGTDCTLLKSMSMENMKIINGGAFGLEGGLAVTIVLLAGTIFLVFSEASSRQIKEVHRKHHA
ncbi:MAG: CPBP family intramembrane metalloprotease, partial [Lachnospiraceae bacterium]|nr:CPBP family intramembrane metalloprotease [Lachnospiraceae bacterium]